MRMSSSIGSIPRSSISGICFWVFGLSLVVPLPFRYAFGGPFLHFSHSRKNATMWKLPLVDSSFWSFWTLTYSHVCWVFLQQGKTAVISNQRSHSKVKWTMLHGHLKPREIMSSWDLYLVLPRIHSCPPATGVVGIFASFHALFEDMSPSFPVFARPFLIKLLSLTKLLSVELFSQGLTGPGLWWRCLHV